MKWRNADGSAGSQEIQIQTRGNFRLARRNCDFPPLRLNVKKEPSIGTLFEGQDKLKLVGVCKLGQDYWVQYVLAEYLVYRMFNLFTPMSFRVRLARVTYIDSSGEDDTFTRYGFIIEDDDAMATRNGGWKVPWETGRQFNPVLLERDQAILVDVFQYMIGNTDWSGSGDAQHGAYADSSQYLLYRALRLRRFGNRQHTLRRTGCVVAHPLSQGSSLPWVLP